MSAPSIAALYRSRKWKELPFQRATREAYARGESGLLHSPTGTGKTWAVWLGLIEEELCHPVNAPPATTRAKRAVSPPLRALWITPLRALAADTETSLQEALDFFGLPWSLESRTGDTSASRRAKQKERLPTALVTTPESLTLLLTREDARELFTSLQLVVVDEWHELLGSKRGVQVELALARLRVWQPELRVWGLSATVGDLEVARMALGGAGSAISLIQGSVPKKIVIDTILPDRIERFPWAGHLSTRLLPQVIEAIESARTTLIFTNTRSQTEIWFQAIAAARPDLVPVIALHHGSLDRKHRAEVEARLKAGTVRAVICTSSLDLGVDFTPVDRVLQVGSPKGVARLLQRAGRSGHEPGRVSRITCVPTHAWELVEVAAARDAAERGEIESRRPPEVPLDVLAQNLVTCAMGGGFRAEELLAEVRTAWAFRELSDVEWQWTLDFVAHGGATLAAYPEYQKLIQDAEGVWRVRDRQVAMRHRLSIGTIVSDASVSVRYLKGGVIGSVEESFVARLRRGDRFIFAGRTLEFVRARDLTAWVRLAPASSGGVVRWMGARMSLSTELSAAIRDRLEAARDGIVEGPEMMAVRELLQTQMTLSELPARDELLIERWRSREGHHLWCYPFAGRLVHEGLAALVAWRLAQRVSATYSVSVNDYGFELLGRDAAPVDEADTVDLFTTDHLGDDILAAMNAAEMARRQFREIARVTGLVFQGWPGAGKALRQIQASSGLLFDVFSRYDPDNLLVGQAYREVLERQLERTRLAVTLMAITNGRIVIRQVTQPTPLGFPLMFERFRGKLSTEKLAERVRRMTLEFERAVPVG